MAPDQSSTIANALRRFLPRLLAGAASVLIGACASTKIPTTTLTGSDPEALSIVTGAQRAQGAESFAAIRDLNVRYGSDWSALGSRVLPVVWDKRYRRESEAALDLGTGTTVQLHKGGGGRKFVLRAPGRVTVWYNGQPDSREDVLRAAAVVTDIGRMELLGSLYFQRPGVILEKLEPVKIGGAECDQVLAVLRPGFGYSEEDRVLLAIDRATQRLRRARLTLRGLRKPGDLAMSVNFRDWGQRSGVWWPTKFNESLPNLFGFTARDATLVDLKANRGFTPRHPELLGEAMSAAFEQQR